MMHSLKICRFVCVCGDDKLLLLLWGWWHALLELWEWGHECGANREILGHLWECLLPPPRPPPPPRTYPSTHTHTSSSLFSSSLSFPTLHLLALYFSKFREEYQSVRKGSQIVLEHNGCSAQAPCKMLVLLVCTVVHVLWWDYVCMCASLCEIKSVGV